MREVVLFDGEVLLKRDHYHETLGFLLQDDQDLIIINLETESRVIDHNHQGHQREVLFKKYHW